MVDDHIFRSILKGCHLDLTTHQAAKIYKAVKEVGFIQNGKLHSWEMYNRHACEYEERVALKQKAAFRRWQHKVEGGEDLDERREPKPEPVHRNGHGNGNGDAPSKKIWIINEALKSAKGKARKELLVRREELIQEVTGVDMSPPPPTVDAPATPPRKKGGKSFATVMLESARKLIADGAEEILSEKMVLALLKAGDELPARVKHKFAKLVAEHGNPVPA